MARGGGYRTGKHNDPFFDHLRVGGMGISSFDRVCKLRWIDLFMDLSATLGLNGVHSVRVR
ncbi:MAG TPA: hypothetical protein DGU45_06595 [Planctomycetes bacterium]|nr:hypothetical protein [Planctomycetota bacterium]